MSENAPNAPAGWYPTPDGAERYWDGSAWLDLPAPQAPEAQTPVGRETQQASSGPRRRTAIVLSLVVVGVLLVGGVAIAVKSASDTAAAELAAADAAAEKKAAADKEAERAAAKERLDKAEADAEMARREAAVVGIEASIKEMAADHLKEGLIDGKVLDVSCSPVAGGSMTDLSVSTTVFECFVSTHENADGTANGYYYNATQNWTTGSYTYGFGEP